MQIIRAEALGMCFGVRDALAIVEEVDEPEVVTIHGELVHNGEVLGRLRDRGFRMNGEADRDRPPETEAVLVTAHGISEAERARLESAGKRLIDTTCPLVLRAHRAAQALQEAGYHVLVIGRRGHVEVRGIVEDLDRFDVIQSADEVRTYPHDRLGIVCQTTSTERQVRAIREAVAARNPGAEVRFLDTVCRPTKERQRALDRLLGQVEAMVVVGGRNSNNTRELVERCRARGLPTLHVERADDLDPEWFSGFHVVGLTAGTSTLDETIDEVQRTLECIDVPLGVGR